MKMRFLITTLIAGGLTLTHPSYSVAQPRDLSTDRPDGTESPITVPKGAFQIEAGLVAYGRDGAVKSWSFGEFNFKYGITNAIDLQLIVPTWQRSKDQHVVAEGFGDLTLRAKINLWGNDGGQTAFALLPFVSLPTGSHGIGSGGTEAGLILPLAIELPAPFGLGLMTEVDAAYDEERDRHHAEWINTIVLGIDLLANVGTYVEFISVSKWDAGDDSDWEGYFSTGLTWEAIPHRLQLDAGLQLGINGAAEDVLVFVGCSRRF